MFVRFVTDSSAKNLLTVFFFLSLQQFSVVMADFWKKLDDKIHRPADLKNVEYRESHTSIFADDKLWFFGLRAVSPTSMNFHETSLLGGFVSVFDLKSKQWSFKSVEKLDEDEHHREHIFVVGNKIFMYVYGTEECYQKLFMWKDDKWSEIKMNADHCSAFKVNTFIRKVKNLLNITTYIIQNVAR